MRTLFKFLSLLVSFTAYGMEHLSEPIQEGVSDLLAACSTADLEMVQELVSSGISVNCVNRYGFTPLHVAVTRGVETEFINLYNSPIPLPGNHAEIVKFLISKGADVKACSSAWGGCDPLYWAARYGTVKILRHLVKAGANIESRHLDNNSTPLHQAARSWNLSNIRCLVGAGADVNAYDNSNRKPADVSSLIAFKGYLTDAVLPTYLLFKALNEKDEETAKSALLQRADIFVVDKSGDTPLHIATRNNLPTIARMLASMGANITRKNYSGERPFTMVVHFWLDDVFGPVDQWDWNQNQ